MRNTLNSLFTWLEKELHPFERLAVFYAGEESEFIRFNQSKVRQGGRVIQQELSLKLVVADRQVSAELNLTGNQADDQAALKTLLQQLRKMLAWVPEDPHLLMGWNEPAQVRVEYAPTVEPFQVIDDITSMAVGQDLVGIFAGGMVYRGFWALGTRTSTRHWFACPNVSFDWSLHLPGNRAIKQLWGGASWDYQAVARKFEQAREQLAAFSLPERTLSPGEYRVWLTPSALGELLSHAGRGFSARALQTRNTPLLRLLEGDTLDPRVSWKEGTARGLGPNFQSDGFARPNEVSLLEAGTLVGKLVSPRSAKEYGICGNGAAEYEAPDALEMVGGDIKDAFEALGTGLFVGNLWYTNISDLSTGRITGLTRFGTFWVEEGKLKGPVSTMRFDDTLFRMLGGGLVGIGEEVELLPSTDSWGMRSTSCQRLPGILVKDWKITL